MKTKYRIKQKIAIFLVLIMCMSVLPYTGMATEMNEAQEPVDAIQMQEQQEQEPVVQIPENTAQTHVQEIRTQEQAAAALNAGNSIDAATSISMGRTYSGTIAENDEVDYYKFSIGQSGKVKLKATNYIPGINYSIYDSNGDELWNNYYEWNSNTNQGTVDEAIDIAAGIYYLEVKERKDNFYYDYYGNYSFQLNFSSAGESFTETNGGTNNTLDTASPIQVNKAYQGQIAWNDEKDFYKVTISSSGRINLKATNYIPGIDYIMYDSNGDELWGNYYEWNSNTNQGAVNESIDLTTGTYYLAIKERGDNYYYDYYGNYSFQLNFTSAGESFKETGNGTNNTLANANSISRDKTYKGQLALNDEKDFYLFRFGGGSLILDATAHMEHIDYIIYDDSGNEVWSKNPYWNDVTQKSEIEETVNLSSGTYYLAVTKYYGCTGKYSFKLKTYIPSQFVKKLSNTGKGIKVSWYKEPGVSGYYVYRKIGSGSWKKVKTTTATSWTDTGAKTNGKKYSYKVRSYKGDSVGKGYAESMYRLSAGKISKAKALKGGKLSVKWKKNSKASGYQIKCVAGSKKITKTVAGKKVGKATLKGLKKGKTYKVYVRSYKKVSGVKYYSAWSEAKKVKGKK